MPANPERILKFVEHDTITAVRGTSFDRAARRILSSTVLYALTVVATAFCLVPRSMADPDIWWHLRNAQTLLTTHRFIGTDTYSFTAKGARWINHEWIGELPFYFGWTMGRATGVYVVTVAAVELLMLGVFLLAYGRSNSLRGAFIVSMVAAVLSTVTYGPRTVLFGWLCLVIELLILEIWNKWPRAVWALPVLFAAWVNTHGSWVIGLVVMLAHVALGARGFRCGELFCEGLSRKRLTKLIAVGAVSIGALFVNPYGWRLVAYPFDLAFHQKLNIANVQEWRSLDLHSPRGLVLLGLLAGVVLLQLCHRRSWIPYEIALVFLGIYAAFTYTRFLVLFSILAAPVLAANFAPVDRVEVEDESGMPLARAALIFFLLCLMIGRYRDSKISMMEAEVAYPADAIPFLLALHPQGRIFNEYLWGGYMIWNLRDIPVFIDSRVDVFEYNGTFKDYLDIVRVKGSLALLDKYKIRYVFFERDTPLVYLVEHAGGWKIDYERGNIVLLERDTGTPKSARSRAQ